MPESYPVTSGILCLRFLPGGPVLPFFLWRLAAGASLVPACEAGALFFRALEAWPPWAKVSKNSWPTSSARGATCSRTWGFSSAEGGTTEEKFYKEEEMNNVPWYASDVSIISYVPCHIIDDTSTESVVFFPHSAIWGVIHLMYQRPFFPLRNKQ